MSAETDLVKLGMGLLSLQAEASNEHASPGWVKRRVQRLEFLDTRAVRWRISVDYVVPEDAPMVMVGRQQLRLVPVTTVAKTSLIAFSLHNEHSVALPLPTSFETTQRLGAALTYWAAQLLDRDTDELPSTLAGNLERIVHDMPVDLNARPPALLAAARLMDAEANCEACSSAYEESIRNRDGLPLWKIPKPGDWTLRPKGRARRECRRTARELSAADKDWARAGNRYEQALRDESDLLGREEAEKVHDELLRIPRFRNQVEELSKNFLVHIGTTSKPGTRRIVKLTYESEIRFTPPEKMRARLRQLLGWRCWQVAVLIGGSGGSHHLQVAAPPGVDIVGITAIPLDPQDQKPPEDKPQEHKSLWQRVSYWDPPAKAKVAGRSPNVQLSPPNGAYSRYQAAIYVRVSRPGWLTGSWLIALVIAGVMIAGWLNLPAVFSTGDQGQAGTAATLLLALLGVFATLLVGPGAHPLAARLLLAARFVIGADVLVILIAVGNLVLHQSHDPMPTVLWTCLSASSLVAGIMMTVSWFLPVARRPHLE